MMHMAMGLSSELLELLTSESKENEKEEVGDMFWYLACLAEKLALNLEEPVIKTMEQSSFNEQYDNITVDLVKNCEKLISNIKKNTIYSKEVSIDLYQELIENIFQNLYDLCENIGYNVNHVMNENIEKLKKRYPEKYTDSAAIERADKIGWFDKQ